MRTRLCYLALVLVPLLAYGPALLLEFGTPNDFVRLNVAAGALESVQDGFVHGALLDISFTAVSTVTDFGMVRGLTLFLVVLCGIALWQILERGGWSELDALAVAVGVNLLPTAQLITCWATTWPAALAALLSLAGFAAAESELEQGGARRIIAIFGGVLLYFASAMCYLPAATMALVPLAALGLSRPMRLWHDTGKWFALHAGLLVISVLGAWMIERWMMLDVGLADRTSLADRAIDLVTVALPSAWALFIGGNSEAMRLVCAALALAVFFGLIAIVRTQWRDDRRVAAKWLMAVGGTFGLFCVLALLSPHWRAGYQTLWSASGVVLVALIVAVRGVGDQLSAKPFWHLTALGAVIAVGVLCSAAQTYSFIAEPLNREWSSLRGAVLRTNFTESNRVVLVVTARALANRAAIEPAFGSAVAEHAVAAEKMFLAGLHARFPSGIPRGQQVSVELVSAKPEGGPNVYIFDLTKSMH